MARPKVNYTTTTFDTFVIPPQYAQIDSGTATAATTALAGCWSNHRLDLLATSTELTQGYIQTSGLQNWYGRLKTLVQQSSGVTPGNANYLSILNSGSGGGSGGAIDLTNKSSGGFVLASIAGSSGSTFTFTAASNFQQEWWGVHNYIMYGRECVVGFSSSNMGYTGQLGAGGTVGISGPWTSAASFGTPTIGYNTVFELSFPDNKGWSGGTQYIRPTSTQDVLDIVNAVKDSEFPAMGVINAGYNLTTGNTTGGTHGNAFISVAGNKIHLNSVASESAFITTPLAPDIAGCLNRLEAPWVSPAGPARGQILNVVKLQDTFTTAHQDTLYDKSINPIITLPGQGTMLFGDNTGETDSTSQFVAINVVNMVNHIKRTLAPLVNAMLFGQNNASTRQVFVAQVTGILTNIVNQGGVQSFVLVCDGTNNTPAVEENRQFVADIRIKVTGSVNFINIALGTL